jgi:DNA-binding CsgD family transcriptional regulator
MGTTSKKIARELGMNERAVSKIMKRLVMDV